MALWRLVRALFGGSHREADVEDGTFQVHFPAKEVAVVAESVPTFKPDTNGVPMLVLAPMAVGAAHLRTQAFPGARLIPMVVATPPPVEHSTRPRRTSLSSPSTPASSPSGQLRTPCPVVSERRLPKPECKRRRTSGTTPTLPVSLTAASSTSSRPVPSTPVQSKVVKVAEPASSDWEHEKALQPKQAREWSDSVKARRQSLPVPPAATPVNLTHHASVPARIPLADRLRRAAVGCASQPPAVRLPPASLSSTSLASATSSESIAHILGSVLDTFEADLKSPLWFGLSQFGEYGGIGFGEVQQNGDGDEDATQSDDNAFDI
ncbi:hypothetical protein B0H14DRAFT_3880896 [Mycena olivaceomarginata]|nr:hypothetical protein B0H14DRAFT_3880896 [Mycena olivaceomarginata]